MLLCHQLQQAIRGHDRKTDSRHHHHASVDGLAVELLGLEPGDEIITSSVTFSTDIAPMVRSGLVPVLVDVTPVNRTRNFHNFSLETPEFFDDLFLRLTNPRTPHSRLLYHFQTSGGADYWVLTSGR